MVDDSPPTARVTRRAPRCRRRQKRKAPTIAVLRAARKAAKHCTRCPLYKHATQTVFGEGPARRAGDVRRRAAGRSGGSGRASRSSGRPGNCSIARWPRPASTATRVYVTNAVKHFKFEPRGKRRIHQKPNNAEIEACRWWLDKELELVKPQLTVALGATAARALTGRDTTISRSRGRLMPLRDGVERLRHGAPIVPPAAAGRGARRENTPASSPT